MEIIIIIAAVFGGEDHFRGEGGMSAVFFGVPVVLRLPAVSLFRVPDLKNKMSSVIFIE